MTKVYNFVMTWTWGLACFIVGFFGMMFWSVVSSLWSKKHD